MLSVSFVYSYNTFRILALICHIGIYLRSTVEPWLSESPLSEPSLSKRYYECKNPKTVQFSAQPNNKWNACVIFRFIISQYSR